MYKFLFILSSSTCKQHMQTHKERVKIKKSESDTKRPQFFFLSFFKWHADKYQKDNKVTQQKRAESPR